MYANIDKFAYDPKTLVAVSERPEIDRWIISRMNRLVAQVDGLFKRYEITKIVRIISDFLVDDVSNWYVRRNRRRFWKSDVGEDKLAAYQTLFEVLQTTAKLIAPVAPFISEEIYRNLQNAIGKGLESVHLEKYPHPENSEYIYRDEALESRMELVRDVVLSGRALRNDAKVKVRQPLPRLIVVTKTSEQQAQLDEMLPLIQEELNIKKITYAADASELMSKKAEPNFKKLGPKFGKNVNQVANMIRELPSTSVVELETAGRLQLQADGINGEIGVEDVRIVAQGADGLVATMDGTYPVALDTTLTPDLIQEGIAREIVNRIQNMRKDAGFEVVDRIDVGYSQADEQVTAALASQVDYIKAETLTEMRIDNTSDLELVKEWKIDSRIITIAIKKVK